MTRAVAVLVLLLSTGGVAPAAASAADERAAAAAFADAVIRLETAAVAAHPAMKAELDATDFAGCALAFGDTPRRHGNRAFGLLMTAIVSAWTRPLQLSLQQLMADLDAVDTADPRLRSGRAAWRMGYKLFVRIAADTGACDRLVAWRARSWRRPPARPPFSLQALGDFARADRKMRRTATRLVSLGVPRLHAERFPGDALFAGAPEPHISLDPNLR
jgi:hypothetical protein